VQAFGDIQSKTAGASKQQHFVQPAVSSLQTQVVYLYLDDD
jgi:hypothetical protein